jgi:hypothetical protein
LQEIVNKGKNKQHIFYGFNLKAFGEGISIKSNKNSKKKRNNIRKGYNINTY